jgi:hypothetical protein
MATLTRILKEIGLHLYSIAVSLAFSLTVAMVVGHTLEGRVRTFGFSFCLSIVVLVYSSAGEALRRFLAGFTMAMLVAFTLTSFTLEGGAGNFWRRMDAIFDLLPGYKGHEAEVAFVLYLLVIFFVGGAGYRIKKTIAKRPKSR